MIAENNIVILIDALNEIADYDYRSGKKGKCPYGCDAPSIARKALQDYAFILKGAVNQGGYKMSDRKFTSQGYEIEVVEKLKSGQYLVRRCFVGQADDRDGEYDYVGEELYVEGEIFDHAPTRKLEATVMELGEQIKDLQYEKKILIQDIRDIKKEGEAKLAKYKKYEQLKNLDMFLDGKITHYVLEYYGSFKIISFEDAVPDERYDKDQTKLLTLFGKSGGNLEWGLSKYSDRSGCNTIVTPCTSYKEALKVAQKLVDAAMSNDRQRLELIKEAAIYDLKVDPEYVRKYEEKERAKKEREIQELEGKLAKLRENA